MGCAEQADSTYGTCLRIRMQGDEAKLSLWDWMGCAGFSPLNMFMKHHGVMQGKPAMASYANQTTVLIRTVRFTARQA